MASSSTSPKTDTCLNFMTHLLEALKDTILNVFFNEQQPEEVEQLQAQAQSQAIASSSCSQLKHQVFLSFRGEDTRLNFTSYLLQALKDTGMNVFFDEEKLEKGEQLSPALSRAINASNLSIIVLSKDYASSKSCLAELSDIMDRKENQVHIVLPIFNHVDPSHVRNIGGSFKRSFDDHESERLHQVQRWKAAFTEVGKLKGWHIEGGKFDRPETEYIKDVVAYVIKKLMNSGSKSISEELVGMDDQKETILKLIGKEDSRVIGLWGMGGIGKTTLADVVYKEVSPRFQDGCFVQNVSQKIEKQGMESLRNELLSKLLNEKEIRLDTPSIGSGFIQERLNNKTVIVVLDDVNDSDQIECMGVKHFGHGSKIIVTSRDKQVLMIGGADKIHEVNKLNENDSLQLFSTFAFRLLNPAADFRHLANEFVKYAQGSPLALRVLGSQLYKRCRRDWESEVDKLKEYAQPKISQILKRSFDGLNELEKNIFLDIACFFNKESKEDVEEILSCCYRGAVSGINNLLDKCLLDIETDIPYLRDELSQCISMHDMLEEMGKDVVRQESKGFGMRSRLWNPKDVYQVLRYNKGTESIEGIKLDMTQIDNLGLYPSVFENMFNLRFILFYFPGSLFRKYRNKKLHADGVDSISLPDELRYLWWETYPFKSLSNFNPKNLVVLKLPHGDMEYLWNEDHHQDLVNLREIYLHRCNKLRKVPNLLGAINLKILCCYGCASLEELPCLNHLASLKQLDLEECYNLNKFPEVPNHFTTLELEEIGIEEVPDSIVNLIRLEKLCLRKTKVKNVSSKISELESLRSLDLSYCLMEEFLEPPIESYVSDPRIEVASSSKPIFRFKSLEYVYTDHCNNLRSLSELPPYLRYLVANDCVSLERVSFIDQNHYELDSLDNSDEFFMVFSNCFSLNQGSIDNIETNAMLKIGSLAKKGAWKCDHHAPRLFCCFSGSKVSTNTFEYQSVSSSLILKISPNGCSGSRFLIFAICLVADLTQCSGNGNLECICEYQLKNAAGGYEKFTSEWYCSPEFTSGRKYKGDHVFILSSDDMVKKDQDYEEASFEFYIKYYDYSGEVDIKVDKCGVHVSHVM